jgi:hypothetical protein
MGNNLSVSTPDCFVWAQLAPVKLEELLAERFTVIRTNGEHQTGWRIPSVTHMCHEGKWSKHHAQAWDHLTDGQGEKSWRFHMVLDDAAGLAHCCGWRRPRTFWPTRLTTEEEKEAWWTGFDALVATLKRTRDMTDAEWIPLYEAQKKREAEVVALWGEDEKEMAFQSRRDEALALDPESAARHAFWTEFDQRLAERKKVLNELRELAAKDPTAQKELERHEFQWGSDERQVADILQKGMLMEKEVREQKAALNERERVLKERESSLRELDAQEQAAVARKDYRAAERAQSQKQTAREYWAEEDAKNA